MKHHLQPVHIVTTPAHGSPVKRGARVVFTLLRSVMTQAQTVPGLVQQAASDIRSAWEETASPKR
jgi:hypothetical protein